MLAENRLHATVTVNPSAGRNPERSYQWSLCDPVGEDCEDIAGATEDTVWARPEDIGQTLRVRVTVTNRVGSFTATSAPSAQIVQAPVPEVVEPPVLSPNAWGTPAVGADPRVGELVWAHIDDVFSEDLVHAETRYRWQRCSADGLECEDVPGTVNSAGYNPRRRDIGFRLRVRVVAIAGHGEAWAVSGLSGVIRDGDPQNTDRPRIVGAPRVREYLWASTGTWDPNPWWSGIQWLRCDEHGRDCTEIPDAGWPEYLTDNDDVGSTWRVRVRAVTGDGSTTVLSPPTAPIGPPGAPENIELPSIWGDPIAGGWTGYPTAFEYQWQRCDVEGHACEDVPGESSATYHVPRSDEGQRLRIVVTARNAGGTTPATSDLTDVIAPMGPPVDDWTPGLWSEMLEASEITAEHGEWSGGTPMTFEYQWKRCDAAGEACAGIPSATARTYTPAGADVEHELRVWIRATNEAGSGEVVSRASTVVRRSAPRFLERPTIDGELREGTLLQATTDGLRGSQPIDLDYTWLRCDSNCAPIPGATAQTYTAQPSDVAARLRLKVTASNTEGTAASWSTVSDEVEPTEVAPADAGKSLRSVVDAQNAIGEAAARSIVSPPMRPRFNTAFSLNGTAPLSAVADALRSADISAWISFSYAGEQTGIFDAGAGATIDAVLDRFDSSTNPDGLDLPVTNFTVAGEVEATDLGDLATPAAAAIVTTSMNHLTGRRTTSRRHVIPTTRD